MTPDGVSYAFKGEFSESQIKDYFRHIANGLKTLHDLGVAHRDIKPQNILLDREGPYLIDFSCSYLIPKGGTDEITSTEGTYHFMAPEMCDCDVKVYNAKKVDVWALGVTLYCMVFNTVPFSQDTGNPYHVMENIKN